MRDRLLESLHYEDNWLPTDQPTTSCTLSKYEGSTCLHKIGVRLTLIATGGGAPQAPPISFIRIAIKILKNFQKNLVTFPNLI